MQKIKKYRILWCMKQMCPKFPETSVSGQLTENGCYIQEIW